jgi:hypothetical protein
VCRTDQLDWILGKIARNLVRELSPLVSATLGPVPDPGADVNHYVWYDDFKGATPSATLGITHIDSVRKLTLVRAQLETALAGICLSSAHMADLVHAGVPRAKLCWITPCHDAVLRPKKLRIGITTRLYTPDPCKREWLLVDLLRSIDPADFCFTIVGSGWDDIVGAMRERGFEVSHEPGFDLERYRETVPTFDYYLYLGWDEGSMGTIDALHAGIPTIATPQGFHLDIEGGVTHPIHDLDSLVSVFTEIARPKRARREAVAGLTWESYARRHLEIWQYLLTGARAAPRGPHGGLASLLDPEPAPDPSRGSAFVDEIRRIDETRSRLREEYDTMLAAARDRRP